MALQTATAAFESPLGPIRLAAADDWLTGARIGRERSSAPLGTRSGETTHDLLAAALDQIEAWFAGTRQIFDLPLAPLDSLEGETLRAGIASIPFGETMTYGALAARTGSVARAVGQACKINPFPIIIPCHRVVSTAGPEYYSGGDGPRTKTWLLDFEYTHLPQNRKTRLL